jgi:hypothetical protein
MVYVQCVTIAAECVTVISAVLVCASRHDEASAQVGSHAVTVFDRILCTHAQQRRCATATAPYWSPFARNPLRCEVLYSA